MSPQPIAIPQKSPRVVAASISPPTQTLHDRLRHRESLATLGVIRQPKVLHPVDNENLRLLLLENISQEAVSYLRAQGFTVDHYTRALSEDELVEKIHSIMLITERVIKAASKLLVIGCFCIGTNQVDLETAAKAGIPVFNSPFSNSRSVAELVIAEIIALSRQLFQRSFELREGIWNKQSKNCWEVRWKTLGIVGYGHIGSQLSVLAEALGMRVIFYDVINMMPLGSARQVETLQVLLAEADFVTLHVPELPETVNMISRTELEQMKEGSYLINNARGRVVLHWIINSWSTTLRSLPNVILSPHIGGSTEEAQRMIGEEEPLTSRSKATTSASVTYTTTSHGVLRQVNDILSPYNVEKQYSDSKGDVAYLLADIADVSPVDVNKLRDQISQTRANILTRLLA
ncbi:hypothetical protein EDD17DRAFT_1819302 [Pisolithus thermaeus]|nr:hypothetical protein EDD17DRAFT_1819302 [Pisolithus thermaeus]